MWEKVQETVNFIKEKTNFTPEFGVILGSGLGDFTNDISIEHVLPYTEIPHFPVSTVQGHKGALVFGTIQGKKVVLILHIKWVTLWRLQITLICCLSIHFVVRTMNVLVLDL